MPPAPDGDDEELVEIDVDVEGPPPPPALTRSGEAAPETVPPEDTDRTSPGGAAADLLDIVDVVELRPTIVEAAEDDPRAEIELYRAEAAAADGGRRAGLMVEVARLEEQLARETGGGGAPALTAARAAFAADPASVVALWSLRRLLSRAGLWAELAEVHGEAARARPGGSDGAARADLLVARGRLLEDWLGRGDEAVAAYREALAVAPEHAPALLSLWLAGVRRGDAGLRALALGGLAARAGDAPRRAALVIEASRAWRAARSDGPARALAALEAEVERGDPQTPLATLLAELDRLTREEAPPEIVDRALALLADRIAAADRALAVAILRERAHLLRWRQSRPQAALEALDLAASLDPAHPAVAAERIELALALDRGAQAADVARAFVAAAAHDDDAVDVALMFAQASGQTEAAAEAAALLEEPRVRACRATRPDLRAVVLAIAVRNHDPAALAEAWAGEAEVAPDGDVAARVHALIGAGAVRGAAMGDVEAGADAYRRALALDPGLHHARPAVAALAALAIAGDRIEEAAGILERALETAATGDLELERWCRETLVSLYADQLGQPGRALPHQRRLVAMRPRSVGARARLCDLELEAGTGGPQGTGTHAGNLLALADLARDPDAAIALRISAGRALVASGDAGEAARGTAILRDVMPADASGLAGAALERTGRSPQERAVMVGEELAAAADADPERIRALRFRLAHHHAAGGAYAEAVAALTPLRSEGDPLARAWSYQLARRSGDAILEIAVLSDEGRAGDGTVADPANVALAYGEALARAGDPGAAANAFRRTIVEAPLGETAPPAALGLFRLAAGDRAAERGALGEALASLAQACAEDPAVAGAAVREGALSSLAAGIAVAPPASLEGDTPSARADALLWMFLAGLRGQDAAVVAGALVAMADAVEAASGATTPEALALVARAAARARLAGGEVAERIAVDLFQRSRSPAAAPALTDLPVTAGAAWPPARPDPRRARARRIGGALGIALHLEAALDAERAGDLAAALAAYGSVIAADSGRLEAWSGVRRVARAGGDTLGEARALARLGALVRDPQRAAGLLLDAGAAYEQAGRTDDAIAALSRAVELDPDSGAAFEHAHRLLLSDPAAPGRGEILEGLLSYRLAAGNPSATERLALLFERGRLRLAAAEGRSGAFSDFKQMLKIDPENVDALRELAQAATADGDAVSASHWIERYLIALDAASPEGGGQVPAPGEATEEMRAARLALAASYEARGDVTRAVAALRRAAEVSPADPRPLERLAELLAARGAAPSAAEALRAAAERVTDPVQQAARWIRMGEILRDAGDAGGAATAFRRAGDLDPLGSGVANVAALYEAGGDARSALAIVEREVADVRGALAANPLDAGRLARLAEWLADARARGSQVGGEATVASVRALATGVALPAPATPATPKNARAVLAALADPAAGGFAAELWPHLADVAEALFPPPATAEPLSTAVAGRLGWVAAVAAALDLPRVDLVGARDAAAVVTCVDRAPPALIVDPRAEPAALAFFAARALALLALRAGALDRTPAADMAALFSCAALLAGGSLPKRLPKPSDALVREVGRLLARKDRKALTLHASRFGFEAPDVEAWRAAVLAVADRFAAVVMGDPAQAAVARAGGAARVAQDEPALALLAFALGDRYEAARRLAEGGT